MEAPDEFIHSDVPWTQNFSGAHALHSAYWHDDWGSNKSGGCINVLGGKSALKSYTFGTGVAQHTFCSHCGMHPFYIPRSQPHRIIVNARCLDDIDGPSLKPTRFFDGRHWEDAQRRRIAESGDVLPPDAHGAKTLQAILDRTPE